MKPFLIAARTKSSESKPSASPHVQTHDSPLAFVWAIRFFIANSALLAKSMSRVANAFWSLRSGFIVVEFVSLRS